MSCYYKHVASGNCTGKMCERARQMKSDRCHPAHQGRTCQYLSLRDAEVTSAFLLSSFSLSFFSSTSASLCISFCCVQSCKHLTFPLMSIRELNGPHADQCLNAVYFTEGLWRCISERENMSVKNIENNDEFRNDLIYFLIKKKVKGELCPKSSSTLRLYSV